MLPLPPQTLLLVGGALLLGRSTACSLDWGASGSLSLPERGESLRFLGQLKSVPAHRCLRDRTDFRCPWKKGAGAREEWQEATCCYPEVLRQVLHLFGSEDSRDAWPEKALEQLLTNVLSDLQDTQRGPAQQQGPSCPPPLAMAIREYFRRISHYLKDKGYGTCSWEIVRAEMQAALSGFAGPAERSPEKRREEKRREEKRREEKRREEKRREEKRREEKRLPGGISTEMTADSLPASTPSPGADPDTALDFKKSFKSEEEEEEGGGRRRRRKKRRKSSITSSLNLFFKISSHTSPTMRV